jgi:hypothetical protein
MKSEKPVHGKSRASAMSDRPHDRRYDHGLRMA